MSKYGQLEFTSKELEKIKDIYGKTDSSNEFEVMFYNYKSDGSNALNMENFLLLLEYMNKRAKIKKLNIKSETTLNVIYGEKLTNFRITINGIESIHKYTNMVSRRKNHIIYQILLSKLEEDKNLSIDKKIKNMENILDVDNHNIRFRLSEETKPTKKEIDQLKELDNESIPNIIFRYRQRVSLIVLDNQDITMQFDLTNTKMEHNINRLERAIPSYELELEIIPKKKKINNYIDDIMREIEVIHKVIQQSNFIISENESSIVLNKYMNLLNVEEHEMKSLKGRKPISLEVQHVIDKLPNRYAVTDKADGDRYFLIIVENKVYLISSNLHIKNTGIVLSKKNSQYNGSILDGEYIFLSKHNRHLFMVFDCLYKGDEDVRKIQSFEERLGNADEVIKACFIFGEQKYYSPKKYGGSFDTKKILDHYDKDIDKYMSSINSDIKKEKVYPLVRCKYFIFAHGGQDNEIFKYSELMWKKYIFDQNTNCPYILDGLIYQPLEQKYETSKRESKYSEYKWKPYDKNSIDFFIKFEKDRNTRKELIIYDNSVEEKEDEGVVVKNQPYKICKLYVGKFIRDREKPVLFQEENENYLAHLFLDKGEVRDIEGDIIQDGTVVEFYYNNDTTVDSKYRWVPMRTRFDKTETVMKYNKNFGNYIDVANSVWRSIINPFTIEDIGILALNEKYNNHSEFLRNRVDHSLILSERKSDRYYQQKSNLGVSMRKFHNHMKDNIINIYCNQVYEKNVKQKILDLSIGRGGDIMKYYYCEIEFCVGIDIDRDTLLSATDGALSRYKDMKKNKRRFPPFYFIHADAGGLLDYEEQKKIIGNMDKRNKELMQRFFSLDVKKRTMFDRISCQFTMHYLLKNNVIWVNFCENINMYLKPSGFFIATCFDAHEVIKLLEGKDKHTEYYTDKKGEKRMFFEILKKFNDNDIDKKKYIGVGRAIDVHNGMINQEDEYFTEYLVDKNFVIKEFSERCNMDLVDTDLFVNFYNMNRDYFRYVIQYEQNKKTRQNLINVSKFYDLENSETKASFKYSILHRYYVFRKREDS